MAISLSASRGKRGKAKTPPPPVTFYGIVLGADDAYALAVTTRGEGDLTISRVTCKGKDKDARLRAFVESLGSPTEDKPTTVPGPDMPDGINVRASGRVDDHADAWDVGLLAK